MQFCCVFVCVLYLYLFSDSLACPGDQWLSFSGSCYLFVNTRQNWFHATKDCNNKQGWLVDIGTDAEDHFLKQAIRQRHAHDDPQHVGYWTSGNDLEVEGKWMWGYPSETPITYTDWFPGEPNNIWYDKRAEDCAALWGHDNHLYQWNDQPCDTQDFYICETEDSSSSVIG